MSLFMGIYLSTASIQHSRKACCSHQLQPVFASVFTVERRNFSLLWRVFLIKQKWPTIEFSVAAEPQPCPSAVTHSFHSTGVRIKSLATNRKSKWDHFI